MKRKLKFNGLWYPANKDQLEKIVKIVPENDSRDKFGVVPHAGLYYSGELIKLFFNNLHPDINKILLIAPSHYYQIDNDVVGSGNFKSFETGFKTVAGFTLPVLTSGYEEVTKAEHAIEMILPFIGQLDNVSLCCAHVNRFTNFSKAKSYAKQLLSSIDKNTAVIASSDFTHYGNNFGYTPFGSFVNDDIIKKVTIYDREIANSFIEGENSAAYSKANDEDKATICGIAPILLVSEMAKLNNMKGRILGQSNSVKGKSVDNNFVSYLSIAWRK